VNGVGPIPRAERYEKTGHSAVGVVPKFSKMARTLRTSISFRGVVVGTVSDPIVFAEELEDRSDSTTDSAILECDSLDRPPDPMLAYALVFLSVLPIHMRARELGICSTRS
jgi:hypothetical protein